MGSQSGIKCFIVGIKVALKMQEMQDNGNLTDVSSFLMESQKLDEVTTIAFNDIRGTVLPVNATENPMQLVCKIFGHP